MIGFSEEKLENHEYAKGSALAFRRHAISLTASLEAKDAEIAKLTNAIRWALGEQQDVNGKWFGEARPEKTKGLPRPWWWRKNLRAISGVDEQRVTDGGKDGRVEN